MILRAAPLQAIDQLEQGAVNLVVAARQPVGEGAHLATAGSHCGLMWEFADGDASPRLTSREKSSFLTGN